MVFYDSLARTLLNRTQPINSQEHIIVLYAREKINEVKEVGVDLHAGR